MTEFNRRRVLIGSLAAVGVAGLGATTASAAPVDNQFGDLERRHNAVIGLFGADLNSGRTVTHRADEMFAMCSTFKAYAAGRVLQMVGDGQSSHRAMLVGDAFSAAQRLQLDDWMRANQTSSMRAALPTAWVTADKTGGGDYGSTNDVGVAYGPHGQRVLLATMTRSQTDDPKAPNLRPLIGELTAAVLPLLL